MIKNDVKLHDGNNLVALSNSILKFFDIPTFHKSMESIDKILKEKGKNQKICILLYDAFGKIIYEKYKDYCPFLYSHIYTSFYSIYPPTTVAATNALLTGKYPLENGFVGWNQYFKDEDKFIDVFINKVHPEDKSFQKNVISEYLKPTFIDEIINKNKGKEIAKQIKTLDFRHNDENHSEDYDAFFLNVDKNLKTHQFIYAYVTEPDHSMHQNGIINEETKKQIIYLNNKTEELVNNNKDVLFILIADHGFSDIKNILLYEDKELISTLKNKDRGYYSTIEGRFASFFVEDENKFKEIYNKKYKDDFLLFSKEELLNSDILGLKENKSYNKYAYDTLGDYFLLATGNKSFQNEFMEHPLIGTHAGITKEEMELNLLIFNK